VQQQPQDDGGIDDERHLIDRHARRGWTPRCLPR
jgi:hypothetical protein